MNDLTRYSGSFWSEINTDSLYKTLLRAREEIERQTRTDAESLSNSISRDSTPLYRTIHLYPIILRRKAGTFLKENLVDIPYITDRIVSPQVLWCKGLEFKIKDGEVTFRQDPFDVVKNTQPVYDANGDVIDEELILWAHNAQFDMRYLQKFWGAPFNLNAPSSEAYREILRAYHRMTHDNLTYPQLESTLSGLVGGVVAKTNEVIETTDEDCRGTFVATDKTIYRSQANGNPLWMDGAHLEAGDAIFDTCEFFMPWQLPTDFTTGITIPKKLLDESIDSDLIFPDEIYPLQINGDFVSFVVNGPEKAVEQFFKMLNRNGELANHLKTRTHINPCRFVLDKVFRNNTIICALKQPKDMAKVIGIDFTTMVRLIIPPHMTLLMVERL